MIIITYKNEEDFLNIVIKNIIYIWKEKINIVNKELKNQIFQMMKEIILTESVSKTTVEFYTDNYQAKGLLAKIFAILNIENSIKNINNNIKTKVNFFTKEIYIKIGNRINIIVLKQETISM